MFSTESFCAMTELDCVDSEGKRGVVECPLERAEATLLYLKNHEDFAFFNGLNFSPSENAVYYWLEKIDSGFTLGIKVIISGALPRVSSIYPSAKAFESEAEARNAGIQFLKKTCSCVHDREALRGPEQSVDVSHFDETVLSSPNIRSVLSPAGEKSLQVKTLEMEVVEARFLIERRGRFSQGLDGPRALESGKFASQIWRL